MNAYIHGAKTPPQEHPFTTLHPCWLQCHLMLLSFITSGQPDPDCPQQAGYRGAQGWLCSPWPWGTEKQNFLGMLPHLIPLLFSLAPGFLPSPFPCSWLQCYPSMLCLPVHGVRVLVKSVQISGDNSLGLWQLESFVLQVSLVNEVGGGEKKTNIFPLPFFLWLEGMILFEMIFFCCC